ncbi:bifunctional DNA primase/polymerase [Microbacterium sp. W4I20]|uniref:bifunctional DNA primase/polymerase n=1 Tax=Microbacterium sp. W4I20 TaxID=3042262 RepID=UPI00278A0B61|nr:bifunctional DNA primase/polymerase [Microbacterium sp. W4I20]MDQ0728772.1 hypothetical protein [Microbacterium sp. W4I20]
MNTAAFVRTLDGSARGLSTAERALAYAAHGIPVFPCAAGGKRPAVAGGFHAATTDPVLVGRWWTAIPCANIGIPTGAASGLVVVDVDMHGFVDGYEALHRARAEGLVDGWTAAVRTPSDGLHLYYPAASESEQRSWQCARAGIDFRGDGGYIIVPPSSRAIDGRLRRYEILRLASEGVHGCDAERLRDFLDPPRTADQASGGDSAIRSGDVQRLAQWVARRQEGERNHGVFWAACRMAEQRVPPFEALDALTAAGAQAGLTEREVATTVRSAYRSVQGAPARPLSSASSATPHRPSSGTALRALA